jgi:hypothetical protein
MIYLKTLFYSEPEIKYLKLNLAEAGDFVDKFIICEFNYNHVGEKRELIFSKYLAEFTEAERAKIIYVTGDLTDLVSPAKDNAKLAHANEQVIRGYFASQVDLHDDDIVFSVDADEIIFRSVYPIIIEKIKNRIYFWQPKSYLFSLYQFFYKINYFWENNKFIGPIACLAKVYKNKYPGQWRYFGRLYQPIAGCHFSWCLSVPEMISKLNSYAHQSDFAHLAQPEILEAAISNKQYPFDPKTDFKIKILDMNQDKSFYPVAIYEQLDNFKNLIV